MRVGLCFLCVLTAAVLPLGALAANPVKGKTYSGDKYLWLTVGKTGAITFHFNRGKLPATCNPGPKYDNWLSDAAKSGKFGDSDFGEKYGVFITGNFVSPTHATGKLQIVAIGNSKCVGVTEQFSLNAH